MKMIILCAIAALMIYSVQLRAQSIYNEISALTERALEKSPEIRMLESKQSALEHGITGQTHLSDPTLSLGLVNMPVNSFSFSQEPMTGKMIALNQKFPFPGELSAKEKVLESDIRRVELEVREVENKIGFEIKTKYFELAASLSIIELLRENRELLSNLADVVRAKYEVGSARQQDILRNDVAITTIDERIIQQKQIINMLSAELRAMLYTDEFSIDIPQLPPLPDDIITSEEAMRIASEERALLGQSLVDEQKMLLQKEYAGYFSYPDFSLTLQYNQRDELSATGTDLNDFLSLIVGITLPLNYGGKNDAMVYEAKSRADYYRQQYKSRLQLLRASVDKSIAVMQALKEREKLTNDVLRKQASQNYNASLSGYQVGDGSFESVIDAFNRLLEIEMALQKIRADYYKEKASLEYSIGTAVK